jgi:hypothetical protein
LLIWTLVTLVIIKTGKLPNWMTYGAIIIWVILAARSPVTGPVVQELGGQIWAGLVG